MADCAFTTKFSRRTILAGTTAATVSAIPAFAAPARALTLLRDGPPALLRMRPSPAGGEGFSDPDAALLRRIALVDWLGGKYVARQERHRRRIKARYKHRQRWTEAGPTWPCLGYWPADPAGWRMFDRYAAAVRSALAVPAHTARGIRAKLGLARRAALTGDRRVYLYEDIDDWLAPALADLERLACRESDRQFVMRTPNGIEPTPCDPDFAQAMEDARDFMRVCPNAMKKLAE